MARSSSSRRWSLPKVLGGLAIAMIVGAFFFSLRPAPGLQGELWDLGLFLLWSCPLTAYVVVVIHVLAPMRWRRRFATLAWCVVGSVLGVLVAFNSLWACENALVWIFGQPSDPHEELMLGVLVFVITIALGFLLGFAVPLAICAWRESRGTRRKTESAASDLE